jgi:hypothetical protein
MSSIQRQTGQIDDCASGAEVSFMVSFAQDPQFYYSNSTTMNAQVLHALRTSQISGQMQFRLRVKFCMKLDPSQNQSGFQSENQ